MRAFSVPYVFGLLLITLAGTMVLPTVIALTSEEHDAARAFVLALALTLFVGAGLILALWSRAPKSTKQMDSLILLAVLWFGIPVFASLPFVFTGMNFHTAMFEAISGFTTTGATAYPSLAGVPSAILVWRAVLQWLGGLTTLMTILVLLGPISETDPGGRVVKVMGSALSGRDVHFGTALRAVLSIYSALTFACFALLWFLSIPTFDAFCLALSTLSTGGFLPRDGTIALYGAPAAQLVLALFMMLGAVNIIFIRSIVQRRWNVVREFREPFWLFAGVGVIGLLIVLRMFQTSQIDGWPAFAQAVAEGFSTAASFVTTSGFPTSESAQELIPFVALILICLIGGGRYSTAGGLKYFRIAAMFRLSGRELRQLIYPHGVRPVRFGGEARDAQFVQAIWANFAVVMLALSVIAGVVAMTGVPLTGSLMSAISALSNVGPAYGLTPWDATGELPHYADMKPLAQFVLSVAMVLGRIELLALLSLLTMAYWRR